MTEAARIRGCRRILWSRDDGDEELATKAEASAEDIEPKDLTTTQASVEEEE